MFQKFLLIFVKVMVFHNEIIRCQEKAAGSAVYILAESGNNIFHLLFISVIDAIQAKSGRFDFGKFRLQRNR